MKYYLYKLKFKTGLHIGDDSGRMSLASSEMTIHADTLFSALCHEALQIGGQDLLAKLIAIVSKGELLFSDAFPYRGDELYLPKPVLGLRFKREQTDSTQKKKFKALKYIPVNQFRDYLTGLKGEDVFEPESIPTTFGSQNTYTKVAIKGMKNDEGMDETRPYHVGVFRFFEECGLYLILSCHEENRGFFYQLLSSLSYSGIGGKRTSGLGKFTVSEIDLQEELSAQPSGQTMAHLLEDENAPYQMSLSVALPADEELEQVLTEAYYTLIRRGGFVQSSAYADSPLKKRVQYVFAPGSCFTKRFAGDVYDVSVFGRHPVYRYAKPVFLGVNI
jgi:CRISPR-associated protein Csm4